jgi:hypothetical protein
VAIAALPIDERTIEAADVWYDGASDDAGTGTFYDWCTPALLARGSGGMDVVAQFCNVTPGCFFNDGTDGGRDSDFFKDIIEQMTGSTGKDISSMPVQAQAAAVMQWFARTKPTTGYVVWVDPRAGVPGELVRREGDPAERFRTLFEQQWRDVHTQLDTLWPSPVTDVVETTNALAASLGIGGTSGGLTPEVTIALCNVLNDLLPFAERNDNAGRTSDVTKAHHATTIINVNSLTRLCGVRGGDMEAAKLKGKQSSASAMSAKPDADAREAQQACVRNARSTAKAHAKPGREGREGETALSPSMAFPRASRRAMARIGQVPDSVPSPHPFQAAAAMEQLQLSIASPFAAPAAWPRTRMSCEHVCIRVSMLIVRE